MVPDEQYLPTCSVKSVTTKFTRFIPANTTVKVGTSQYILKSDGGVGQTLSAMLIAGTAIVDPCCNANGSVSSTSTKTTISQDSVVIGNGTGAIGIFPGAISVSGAAKVNGTLQVVGATTFSAVPSFTNAAGTCTHNVVSTLDTFGIAVVGLTTGGLAFCQYTSMYSSTDTNCAVYQYKNGWITFQGKYKRTIKYWIPKH